MAGTSCDRLSSRHGAVCCASSTSYSTLDGDQTWACGRPAVWHTVSPHLGRALECGHYCDRHGKRIAKLGEIALMPIAGVAVKRTLFGRVKPAR